MNIHCSNNLIFHGGILRILKSFRVLFWLIRGGVVVYHTDVSIQDAINNAQTSDIIRLENGATFNEHDLTTLGKITNLTYDVWNAAHTVLRAGFSFTAGAGRIHNPPKNTNKRSNIPFSPFFLF